MQFTIPYSLAAQSGIYIQEEHGQRFMLVPSLASDIKFLLISAATIL